MVPTVNQGPTPVDDDWEAEFDPSYDEKTKEGGVWDGLEDDVIVLLQIEDFKNDEHEERHRRLDEIEADKNDD